MKGKMSIRAEEREMRDAFQELRKS